MNALKDAHIAQLGLKKSTLFRQQRYIDGVARVAEVQEHGNEDFLVVEYRCRGGV